MTERLTGNDFIEKLKAASSWKISFDNVNGEYELTVIDYPNGEQRSYNGPNPVEMTAKEFDFFVRQVDVITMSAMQRSIINKLRREPIETQEPKLEDLLLTNRGIIPLPRGKWDRFGVVITEDEAVDLTYLGYSVKGYRLRKAEEDAYYLIVRIGAHQRDQIDLAGLETVGYADVVVHPEPWEFGKRKGIVAFVKTAIPKPR